MIHMDIEISWSPAGTRSAHRNDIAFHEAIDVIYAPTSIQILVGDDVHAIYFIGGRPGRVIVVLADRQSRNTNIYEISSVTNATEGETRAWEKRQKP